MCSISPIVEVIGYANTESQGLGEIYETFNSMLGQVRVYILARDPRLEFYTLEICPIIQCRQDTMNAPLHVAAYALNPKLYMEGLGRLPPKGVGGVSKCRCEEVPFGREKVDS